MARISINGYIAVVLATYMYSSRCSLGDDNQFAIPSISVSIGLDVNRRIMRASRSRSYQFKLYKYTQHVIVRLYKFDFKEILIFISLFGKIGER